MKRKDALTHIRIAGYHNDNKGFVRFYIENRVSYEAARAEFRKGQKLKENGILCNCYDCKKAKENNDAKV